MPGPSPVAAARMTAWRPRGAARETVIAYGALGARLAKKAFRTRERLVGR